MIDKGEVRHEFRRSKALACGLLRRTNKRANSRVEKGNGASARGKRPKTYGLS
jgi:hypothetical protein